MNCTTFHTKFEDFVHYTAVIHNLSLIHSDTRLSCARKCKVNCYFFVFLISIVINNEVKVKLLSIFIFKNHDICLRRTFHKNLVELVFWHFRTNPKIVVYSLHHLNNKISKNIHVNTMVCMLVSKFRWSRNVALCQNWLNKY